MSNKTIDHPCLRSLSADKGMACRVDASSVVCTLVNKGKLANKIATLLPIVVKHIIPTLEYLKYFTRQIMLKR